MNKYNWMTELSINDLIDKIGNYWDDDINNDDVQNEFFYAKSYCKLRVADLLMEIERLKAINTQIEWVCAYCGERFLHTIDAATEHILECEKHPLYQAKRRITELESKIVLLMGETELAKEEGEQ